MRSRENGSALRVHCDFGGLGLYGGRLRIRLADVDAALEERAIFNADAGRGHVAGEGAFGTDVDAISGIDVALELAEDDDFAGADAGRDIAVLAHRDAIAGNADAALNLAVDEQGFGAGNLALDGEALADAGLLADRRRCSRARRFKSGLPPAWESELARGTESGRVIGLVGWVST